jgi:hypothetical protein
MATDQTSPKQNQNSRPTSPNAKPAENAPEENFEELLRLNPDQVQSVKVLPKK